MVHCSFFTARSTEKAALWLMALWLCGLDTADSDVS